MIEDMVMEEHDELRATVAYLIGSEAEDGDQRRTVLARLIVRLADHEEAEERTFYRSMREDDRLREMALEGVEQHRIIETLLEGLEQVKTEDELWLPKLRAMKGVLDSHLLVEERLLLPTARDILGDETMERLGKEFDKERGAKVGVIEPSRT